MTALVEVQDVGKVFTRGLIRKQHLVALESFSMTIPRERPTIITVAGESGSGKTTLSLLILGLLAPSSGQIRFNGDDVWKLPKSDRRRFRREVQAIFQDPYGVYNPFYQVDAVLETVISKFQLASDREHARALMIDALEILGLKPSEILGKYPHQLSGGQRQRIMIARAFLPKPRLIVADEPVSMVDASLRALILENMLRLKREFGISFVYITHDLSTAYQVSDEIYILYLGTVVERGDIEQVIQNPQHPYTRLLVASVPISDPDATWKTTVDLPPEDEIRRDTRGGCRFARRCPFVMDQCRRSAPPLFEVGPNQYAACFLYQDRPIMARNEPTGSAER